MITHGLEGPSRFKLNTIVVTELVRNSADFFCGLLKPCYVAIISNFLDLCSASLLDKLLGYNGIRHVKFGYFEQQFFVLSGKFAAWSVF